MSINRIINAAAIISGNAPQLLMQIMGIKLHNVEIAPRQRNCMRVDLQDFMDISMNACQWTILPLCIAFSSRHMEQLVTWESTIQRLSVEESTRGENDSCNLRERNVFLFCFLLLLLQSIEAKYDQVQIVSFHLEYI